MVELETAHFYLSSLSASINIDNKGSQLTFKNFNIRECLGDLYNKYDKFKMVLTSVQNYNAVGLASSYVALKMIGLDWLNCYDYTTGDRISAYLGLYTTGSGTFRNTLTTANFGCDFNKPNNGVVDLQLIIHDLATNSVISSTYGHSTYCFIIYGVK